MPALRITRRKFLRAGVGSAGVAAVAAVGGVAGYEWPQSARRVKTSQVSSSSPTPTSSPDVVQLRSRPELRPPRVRVADLPDSTPPPDNQLYFISPKAYETALPAQDGLMIVDARGRIVWFSPTTKTDSARFDLQVQEYKGKPVLTWWQGHVLDGTGWGTGYLLDTSYRAVTSIHAGNGLSVDLHELNLTPRGTALITAYRTAETDLSAVGGPRKGKVYACQAQEIDVATGKMLFSWDSLDHVGVDETYQKFTPGKDGKQRGTFDYFHINSVSQAPDGDLLISARNTWTIYKISKATGKIVWRLNGKRSDFTMGPGTHFYWQHHSRVVSGRRLSLFDDGASPAEEAQSRGLILDVDTSAKRVSLAKDYTHPAQLLAQNQGSVQVRSNGNVVVGWGNQPYFSEFTADGTQVLDSRLPMDIQSYRAFTFPWTGHPTDRPALAVESDTSGGATVFASWNGSTEVARWEVLSGPEPTSLRRVAAADWGGLETVITANHADKHVAVVALDADGRSLGRSPTVATSA